MRTHLLGLGVVLLSLQACSGDPEATGDPVTPGEPTRALDCARLVPAEAVDALGWPAAQPAEHAGRCLLRTRGGEVTVGTRAVPAADGVRADAVQQELAAQCDRLRTEGAQFVGEPEWFAEGQQGCLTQVDARSGTGVAELVVLNAADEVVQIRVAASSRVEEEAVDAALEALARASADLCEARCP